MAHFAQLDKDDRVLQVIVVDNNHLLDDDGVEQEAIGIAYLQNIFGDDTKWLQCSYHAVLNGFRRKFPGEGWYYMFEDDTFINPDDWFDKNNPAHTEAVPSTLSEE